ncbi:MAG: DNA alkylation repair protein [Clostridia bacterium]|nr:DNA alkylation repair protein [Clostridia bacterium]
MNVTENLLKRQDTEYKAFHSKLMPTVDGNRVIGIRIPVLRKFAKELSDEQAKEFMSVLPHYYYEENNLHAFLIERIGDYDECIKAVNAFLPFVDNWATCDSLRPKVFKKHLPELLDQIKIWISSKETYTVRFGLEMLMCYYLDEAFKPEYLTLAAGVKSEEYYVNMMLAWFFATALAKQYDSTITFIENNILDIWVHNKTIQKAVESYRITDEQKVYLKTLKRG